VDVSEADQSSVNDLLLRLCSSRPTYLNTDADGVIVTVVLPPAALLAYERDTRPLPLKTSEPT
jgi:hypothetical protein